ncbi:engulfment and cell motility ELM family protein [Heterostelium album PN500]|uniref:Engulfment and cell motility ELM family protein n=1 Tax=Heterostelium pallidum (strain ATCC 26659 / Pp 5 / PN500) TaxID=670386 RepID=D3BK56_HETP5|nr:engulfment and cell motility ELM family protein [Heterostelium album PN500]EFA78286.1 engulfment and cell motility ELM family protein [Heterostelium album PN500]|eukprot:XP_020430411.1 engulfment and cell motility ELM family protein [Heterostelium album PN500]
MYCPLFLWKIYKFFVHLYTGRCEIERLCHNYEISNHNRRLLIEQSIENSSKLNRIKTSLLAEFDTHTIAMAIVEIKKINQDLLAFESTILPNLEAALEPLSALQSLKAQITLLRDQAYDSENEIHEEKLDQLWNSIFPNKRRSARITSEWGHMGFQGKDPATDFRGMGLLGLENLLYLATNYEEETKYILECANSKFQYPFAITGINITSKLVNMLLSEKNHLKNHFIYTKPSMRDFNELYAKVFISFNNYYQSKKPENVMQFGPIINDFIANLHLNLLDAFDTNTNQYNLSLF